MDKQLAKVFRKVFDIEVFTDDLSSESIESWDSFAHIELIMEIEAEFNVSVPTDQVVKLTSVPAIRSYLVNPQGY